MDEFIDNYAEWKKPITKCCILYDSILITFLKCKIIGMKSRVIRKGNTGILTVMELFCNLTLSMYFITKNAESRNFLVNSETTKIMETKYPLTFIPYPF